MPFRPSFEAFLKWYGRAYHNRNTSNFKIKAINNYFVLSSDLDGLSVETTACVEEGGTVLQGGECEYSCQVSGMDSGDTFTIAKVSVQSYGLGFDM